MQTFRESRGVFLDMEEFANTGYLISTDGRVIGKNGKVLKQHLRKGYCYITIGKHKFSVHRMVALTYIPNPENKPEIDHIDGNPLNNNVDNLRWVTRQENEMNPITRQRISKVHKGKIITAEQREKLRLCNLGKKQSDETKKKRADKLRGRKRPKGIMQRLSELNKKPIVCIVNKTGETITFNSQKEAAETLGISQNAICNNISGKRKSRYYTWIRL